ncbi:MAG: hypothetical protein CR988_03790 [Treponema sp.]|nr:MAG: hypothetical protein CR988_03790 [Treponema sp.]
MKNKSTVFFLFFILTITYAFFPESSDEDIETPTSESTIPVNENTKNAEPINSSDTNETPEEKVDNTFSSITKTGLIIAENNHWYYEKYNKQKLRILSVMHEGNKLIEKKEWKYSDNNLLKQKNIQNKYGTKKIFYDNNGNIIKTIMLDETGKTIYETSKTYDNNNRVIFINVLKNGIEKRKEIKYNTNGTKQKEINYKNGRQISLIEYHDKTKTVHLYDNGIEISSFTERINE